MRWPWQTPEAEPSRDEIRTPLGPLVERLESLERRMATLAEDLRDTQDTIARRLDKYRKRLERDEAPPEADGGGTVHQLPLRPPNGTQAPRHAFDVISIRRGGRTFPGGSR